MSNAKNRLRIPVRDAIAAALVLLLVLLISLPNLRSGNIDDLDSAHHLMDGYFFYDLFRDHPHTHLQQYAFTYYKQYPALGFIFWPPFFPFVLGIFCLVFGPHVLTARLCLLFFGAVFGVGFYAIMRRSLPVWLSLAATAAAVTVPGMAWSFNEIMLELPTLAVMCVAVLAFFHVMDHREEGTRVARGLLCGTACAAVIYTKQPAWFLYPVLLVEGVLHQRIFRKPEAWIAIAAIAVLGIPLVLFTLKFGHADIAQSVGSNTKLIMSGYKAAPRWSLASWVFYPSLAWSFLNPAIVLLAGGGLILAVLRADFRRKYAFWLAWFVFAYLTFSLYDNKLARHSTFWWPAWIALAAAFLKFVMEHVPPRSAQAFPLLLLLPLPWQVHRAWGEDYSDYRNQRPLVAQLMAEPDEGNVLIFGPDKQTFIALIREYDPARKVHVLRGDDLLGQGKDLAYLSRQYRIRTVIVELPAGDDMAQHPDLQELTTSAAFQPIEDSSFLRRQERVRVLVFRYNGPLDPKMADVPLSDRLL